MTDLKPSIYIGAGHRGFALKESLKEWLGASAHDVVDCGAAIYDATDDYPDYAQRVAKYVAAKDGARGIVLCGSGNGVCVGANKVNGVRAGLALSAAQIRDSVAHDHLNVLCISADYTQPDDARRFVEIFLSTPYSQVARHLRRVAKITQGIC